MSASVKVVCESVNVCMCVSVCIVHVCQLKPTESKKYLKQEEMVTRIDKYIAVYLW